MSKSVLISNIPRYLKDLLEHVRSKGTEITEQDVINKIRYEYELENYKLKQINMESVIDKDYVPFGEEWAAYLKKQPKDFLIESYRRVCMENSGLKEIINSKWIDVNDKLPEIAVICNIVLKHLKNNVYCGFRVKGGWYVFQIGEEYKYYVSNGNDNVKITHWQPLAELTI